MSNTALEVTEGSDVGRLQFESSEILKDFIKLATEQQVKLADSIKEIESHDGRYCVSEHSFIALKLKLRNLDGEDSHDAIFDLFQKYIDWEESY